MRAISCPPMTTTTVTHPQQNPAVPLDSALSVIEVSLGRPVQPIDGDPDHRMVRFGSEEEARQGVSRLRQSGISAEAREDATGWFVVVGVRVSPPPIVNGAFSATLRFQSAQFIPGGPARITLVSEAAALGHLHPAADLLVDLSAQGRPRRRRHRVR